MSEKRRDSKGRILKEGEVQRKDGRYEYKYVDSLGTRKSVYSWRLVETDKTPAGKRSCIPLREIEKSLKDMCSDMNISSKVTLNDFFDDYMENKLGLKRTTRIEYQYLYSRFVRDTIGRNRITDIKYSDIWKFYTRLIDAGKFQPNSIENIQTLLRPVFKIAVRDGVIRSNPADGVITEIKQSYKWENPVREPLTLQEQERLIEFVSTSPKYRKHLLKITLLLGTGCRIGEMLGLRWEDCNFEEGYITVNHTLTYGYNESGECEFHISTPKTASGKRLIPMFEDVRNQLLLELDRQKRNGFSKFTVDGCTNFIFKSEIDKIITPSFVNRTLSNIVRDANIIEKEAAESENREPILLPHFSCHNLRHTFCTRLCEQELNVKVIQDVMGHRNIETTMNIYAKATKEKKQASFKSIEGRLRLS